MKHYRITEQLRTGLNDFLGNEFIKRDELGNELYYLRNYDTIANISPEKVKLVMATLFPEELADQNYLFAHRDQIRSLTGKLHVEETPSAEKIYHWTSFVVRPEGWSPEMKSPREEPSPWLMFRAW